MSILDALIQVESSGIPGRRGPMTKYGQALGLGQTLPGTAREMAQKLGLPWRPDLLTSPTPEGAAYQRAVSQAYYDQGLERTGNPRDALRYYHGGPNRRQWGPKTNAYADKVMALSGGDTQPMMPPTDQERRQSAYAMQPDTPDMMAEPTGLAGILQTNPADLVPQAMTIKGPGAFGKGSTGRTILGIIADGIARGFGGQPGYGPALDKAQEQNRTLELWRQKVEQDRKDRLDEANLALQKAVALARWKQQNPDAPDPTTAARMAAEAGFKPGTPEFQREVLHYMRKPTVINGQPWGYDDNAPEAGGKTVVRTGVDASGRRVAQYSDGTIDYAD